MADHPPNGRMAAASPGGGLDAGGTPTKKELSNDELKVYIRKIRTKVKKLEEENKALHDQAEAQKRQDASGGGGGGDTGA